MWQKINHRKREKMLIGVKIDDNIFCPLIAVHIIANYCRCYSMNRVSCDGSFTMHWPFTNHRSFTIDAFSWGAGPIPWRKKCSNKKQPFKPVIREFETLIYNIQPLRDFQSISSMFCNLVLHRPISHGPQKRNKSTRIKSYKILIREDSHIYMYHNLTRCCSKSTLAENF